MTPKITAAATLGSIRLVVLRFQCSGTSQTPCHPEGTHLHAAAEPRCNLLRDDDFITSIFKRRKLRLRVAGWGAGWMAELASASLSWVSWVSSLRASLVAEVSAHTSSSVLRSQEP